MINGKRNGKLQKQKLEKSLEGKCTLEGLRMINYYSLLRFFVLKACLKDFPKNLVEQTPRKKCQNKDFPWLLFFFITTVIVDSDLIRKNTVQRKPQGYDQKHKLFRTNNLRKVRENPYSDICYAMKALQIICDDIAYRLCCQ